MADLYAFDAAYTPDLAAVKAAGGIAINGYLDGTYQHSTTQLAAAHAAGLGYIPTYEQGPAELVYATRATGQAVGRRILADFRAKGLALDGSLAVFPSIDTNVSEATACDNGWLGLNDILHGLISVRTYAEGLIIDHLTSRGLVAGKCWLAAPSSWPGYNPTDANVCMVQQLGNYVAGTDRNHIITDPHAIGASWPAGSIYSGVDMDANQAKQLDDVHTMLTRLSFGLDPGGSTPYSERGELVERVRTVDGHTIAQPPTADTIAGVVATKISPALTPATAQQIADATAAVMAARDTQTIVDGVLAALPKGSSPEQIAAIATAVRVEFTNNPLTTK